MTIAIGLIALALLGAPLFTVFGAASIALFSAVPNGSWASVGIDVFGTKFAEQPMLTCIPFYTFAGFLLAESGASRRLVLLSRAWLGWLPGSLAIVAIGASAFITTLAGSSGITIAAASGLLFPALIIQKYPPRFSRGLVTTGGSLGVLFPPSVPLIMFGFIAIFLSGTGMVLQKLLVAGIIPGLLCLSSIGIYSAYVSKRSAVPRTPVNVKNAFRTAWISKWEVAIPIVLFGGIALNVFHIYEAAALTALYVLLIEVCVYRDINIVSDLPRIIIESMILVGAILVILACALGFTGWMVFAQVPDLISEWMGGIIQSKWWFFLALSIFLLFVGMLMDIFTASVVVVPLIVFISRTYSIDPYHLAVIFLLNLEIGYLMPPLGMNLFISSIRFKQPLTHIYRPVLPFVAILLINLIIVICIPQLTTWLPSLIEVTK